MTVVCSHGMPIELPCQRCVSDGLEEVSAMPSQAPKLERKVRAALGRFNDPGRDVAVLVAEVVARVVE